MNHLIKFSPGDTSGVPLAELKLHVLLFGATPPGPKTAQRVLDLYFQTFGDRFVKYGSTTFGSTASQWSVSARERFLSSELPMLRKHADWGFALSDGRPTDSWMLMFHGYRPFSEPGRTSFYRFEFDFQVDADRLKAFATDLTELVTCVSGYVGYVFQGRPRGALARSSFDQVFAWSRRYWCVEVQDLDEAVYHMANGYKCVNWITIIGDGLRQRDPAALERASEASYSFVETSGGVLLQASAAPLLGDRNRLEPFPGYIALGEALESIQVKEFGTFGNGTGSRWTEANTMAWLRRFEDPEGFASST